MLLATAELLAPSLAGILVGISLGLTGGGGSIFALPLLVHVLHASVRESVTISLAAVGSTALFGAILKRGHVDWQVGLLFALAGIVGAPFGSWLGTKLPPQVILLGFAGLMVIAGLRMWRRPTRAEPSVAIRPVTNRPLLISGGLVAGILAGIFGVGGGFIVVPALVLGAGLPMRQAVATSLFAIALISASAFISQSFNQGSPLNLQLLAPFTAGAWAGMAAGSSLRSLLSEIALRRTFAVSMWGVAIAMVFK